jgi:nitric oxide reductase NorE protein
MTAAATHKREALPVRTPGQWAMWVFVFGDMFIFAGWFTFYMIARLQQPEAFLESQHALNQTIGMLNTLILLFSSFFIALCVHAAREGRHKQAERYTWIAFIGGAAFILAKIFEWSEKMAHGHTFDANAFFMFYYFLTGVHVFHVFIGLIVLGIVIRETRTPAFRSQEIVETGATYWHMVDFIWVIIFALLYLMR